MAIALFFYFFLCADLIAAAVGGVIWCVRRFRRVPRRVAVPLWGIMLFRLWSLFGVAGSYGFISGLSDLSDRLVGQSFISVRLPLLGMDCFSAMNCFGVLDRMENEMWVIGFNRFFYDAAIVWLAVFLVLLILTAIGYAVSMRRVKKAVPFRDNVYLSDAVKSPAVYGIFRPKIVLPSSYADRDLTYILMHENEHIRRCDNFVRLLAFVSVLLHWFDPLVWICLKSFLSDLEMACDEGVLRGLDEEGRKAYALALLDNAPPSSPFFVSAFGGAKLRERIERIMSYRKTSVASAILYGALWAVLVYLLLTNAP